MSITDSKTLYGFVLQQMAAESYFEGIDLGSPSAVAAQLRLGTNRIGYQSGPPDLNEGYPGYTRMTTVMADEFLSHYKVVHQWSDNPTPTGSRPAAEGIDGKPKLNTDILANTGFSATLIQDKTTGEYTLSMRSTEYRNWAVGGDGERDKSGTDIQGLAQTGFALAQLDAMEKYYQWLKDNQIELGIDFGSPTFKLNVTGYSLGGHLATVFKEIHQGEMGDGQTVTFNGAGRGANSGPRRFATPADLKAMIDDFDSVLLDPELVQPPVSDLSLVAMWQNAMAVKGAPFDPKDIYTDARYIWAAKATAFVYGLTTLPLTSEGNTAGLWTNKITQVVGTQSINNLNFTANSGVHGPVVKVGIESQPLVEGVSLDPTQLFAKDFGNAHSITLIADSLALQRALTSLDSNYDLTKFLGLMALASNRIIIDSVSANYEADVLENILDAVRHLVLAPGASNTEFKDGASGFADITAREVYHTNLKALTDSAAFTALAGKVTINASTAALQTIAHTDFAAIAALQDLSPVYLAGKDAAGTAALDTVWQATRGADYSAWLADKNSGVKAAFSDQWLSDRADLLERKTYYNAANASYDSSKPDAYGYRDGNGAAINSRYDAEDIVWEDRPSGLTIQRGSVTFSTKHVVFGSDASESDITGDRNADHLYAGAGADTLSGLGGNDYLEGGKGADTYQFTGAFGHDTLLDAGGAGTIRINSDVLDGGIKLTDTIWESADRKYIYVVVAGDLIIGQRTTPGAATVTDTLTVKNWHASELGLTPQSAAAPAPAPLSHLTVYQDYSPAANNQGSTTAINDGQGNTGANGGDYNIQRTSSTGQASVVYSGAASQFITADSWDQQVSSGDGNDLLQDHSNRPDSIANNDHSTLGNGRFDNKNGRLTACGTRAGLRLARRSPGPCRASADNTAIRSAA